jgi:hypothetical protein
MVRPFSRQNDGRDEFDRLSTPDVRDTWRDGGIMDHGLLYNSPTGTAPLQAHSFSPVAAAHMTDEQIQELQIQQNAELQNQNSGNALILSTPNPSANLNAGSGAGNLSILTADDSSPPAGDTGTISQNMDPGISTMGGGSTCPKSDCLLWAVAGLWLGRWVW